MNRASRNAPARARAPSSVLFVTPFLPSPPLVRRPATPARAHLGRRRPRTTCRSCRSSIRARTTTEAIRATEEYCRRVVTVPNPAYRAGRRARGCCSWPRWVRRTATSGSATSDEPFSAALEQMLVASVTTSFTSSWRPWRDTPQRAAWSAPAAPDPVPRRAQHRVRHRRGERPARRGRHPCAERTARSSGARCARKNGTRGVTWTDARSPPRATRSMLLADAPSTRTAVVPNGVDARLLPSRHCGRRRTSRRRCCSSVRSTTTRTPMRCSSSCATCFPRSSRGTHACGYASSAAGLPRASFASRAPRRGDRSRRRCPTLARPRRRGRRPSSHRRRHPPQDPRGDGDGKGGRVHDARGGGARRRAGARPARRRRRREASSRRWVDCSTIPSSRGGASERPRGKSSRHDTAGRPPWSACCLSTTSSWKLGLRRREIRTRPALQPCEARGRTCPCSTACAVSPSSWCSASTSSAIPRRRTTFESAAGEARQLRHLGCRPVLRAVRFLDHRPPLRLEEVATLFPELLRAPDASHLPALLRRPGLSSSSSCRSLPAPYPAALAESGHHQAWLWLYASNVYLAMHRAWALPYVGHFWSLAVEEQFYLFWPVVVLDVRRRSVAPYLHCGHRSSARAPLAFCRSRAPARWRSCVLTPCRLDALCIGGLLALGIRSVGLERVARAGRLVPRAARCPRARRVRLERAVGLAARRGAPDPRDSRRADFGALLAVGLAAPPQSVSSRLLSQPRDVLSRDAQLRTLRFPRHHRLRDGRAPRDRSTG